MKDIIKNVFIFILLFVFGQKIIVMIFPYGEFLGQGIDDWILWTISPIAFSIGVVIGLFVAIVVGYWIVKSGIYSVMVMGVVLGAYYSYMLYPLNNRIMIENYFLSENPSLYSIIVFYSILLAAVPVVIAIAINSLLRRKRIE